MTSTSGKGSDEGREEWEDPADVYGSDDGLSDYGGPPEESDPWREGEKAGALCANLNEGLRTGLKRNPYPRDELDMTYLWHEDWMAGFFTGFENRRARLAEENS